MLSRRAALSLGQRGLQRVGEHGPGAPRLDHIVHVAPLGARIIFVADAYDAMTSERVYRRRVAPEQAVAELERCAGSQFDPEIVAALADELALEETPTAAALAS